jgi:DNA-binding NtrC family response regulator
MANILIVDDEETFAKNAARYLERAGHVVEVVGSVAAAVSALAEGHPDVVVLDYRLPDGTGMDLVQRIRAKDDAVHLMLVTGHGTIELAVEAMKAGANDLLTKPVSLAELRDRIAALTQRQRASSRLRYYETREREASHELRGESAAMHALRERLDRIAAIDGEGMLPPVLITGETGTGKELVARAVHYRGPRRQRPFIEINCAAIPPQLLESELFGHERGAFTDAKERRLGLLEAADGGTLFLDEVGDMEPALQAKLLKVIEDGRYRRVGSVQEQRVQLRVVAATHQDLDARVAGGAFRADLLFRLRVLQLKVPPLRERDGDAVLLARHFCAQFAQRYQRLPLALSVRAEAAIAAHHWPGNVRELRNVVEQAVLLAPGPFVEDHDLALPAAHDRTAAPDGGSQLDRAERELLLKALADAQNNVSLAARELGISRDTLRYRMEKHGLKA